MSSAIDRDDRVERTVAWAKVCGSTSNAKTRSTTMNSSSAIIGRFGHGAFYSASENVVRASGGYRANERDNGRETHAHECLNVKIGAFVETGRSREMMESVGGDGGGAEETRASERAMRDRAAGESDGCDWHERGEREGLYWL